MQCSCPIVVRGNYIIFTHTEPQIHYMKHTVVCICVCECDLDVDLRWEPIRNANSVCLAACRASTTSSYNIALCLVLFTCSDRQLQILRIHCLAVCPFLCVCVTKGNSAVRVAICACTEAHSCHQTLERVWVGKAESQRRTRCVSERELNAHTHTRTFF